MKRIVIIGCLAAVLALLSPAPLPASGNWEFNVHYSAWSLNMVRSVIEDNVGDVLEDNLRDKMIERIREEYPDIYAKSYTQSFRFDSSGSNYGVEVRFFPGGRQGSFSLGVALEKTAMKVGFPTIESHMVIGSSRYPNQDGYFDAAVTKAEMELKPVSAHFSLRWEIKPSWKLHPYITLGAGFFGVRYLEKGTFYVAYSGTLRVPGQGSEHIDDVIDKTVKQALDETKNDEGDPVNIPSILPIVQLNVGLRGELTPNVNVLFDFGIWDGFLFRGGLSLRF